MKLQYEFPLTPTPIDDVAESLGIGVDEAVSRLRRLHESGVLKRIGFYYNYRAQRKVAALVAFRAGDRYRDLASILNRDHEVTHNFLRNHPVYNVWAIIKRETREELIRSVEEVARKAGISDWIILFSKKTLKLSVKYDLYEGVSRSGPYSRVVENPPTVEQLGLPRSLPWALRILPIERRPYRRIAEKHGMSEEEVVDVAVELLKRGVLGDPGAALEGRAAGFTENGMVVMEPEGDELSLSECAAQLEYSTHVVLREAYPPGSWRHICYFMAHATSREKIERVRRLAEETCKPRDVMVLYSIEDLKPHIVR
jgi:DNA-binding Lrp family transcriptional regulator